MSTPRSMLGKVYAAATGKAALTILDQGIVSAANFLSSIIVGRACLKDEFGLYMLAFSMVVIATNTQISLITAAYTVFSPRMEEEARARYTGSTLIHQWVLSGGIIVVLAGLFAGFALTGKPEGLAPVIGVLAALIGFILLKDYARQVCFAGLRTKAVLILDSAVFVLQVGGLLGLTAMGWISSRNAYAVIGAVCAGAGGLWLWTMRGHIRPRLSEALPHFKMNWGFSKWFFAYNLAFIAANQLYPWLLAAFHGTAANGVFGACTGVVFFANPFIIGLGNFLGPRTAHAYAQGGPAELRRIVSLANTFFLLAMAVFAAFMFLLGDWFLVLLYGRQYAGNGWVVGTLAAGQLVWALTVPSNFGLNAVERPDVSFKSLLLSLAVMLTLGLWFVYAGGPMGVACGLLAGNIAACLYTRVAYAKHIRVLEAQRDTL